MLKMFFTSFVERVFEGKLAEGGDAVEKRWYLVSFVSLDTPYPLRFLLPGTTVGSHL